MTALTTHQIMERLRARHAPKKNSAPEWCWFEEVSIDGGRRRVDGLAVNRWDSRGFAIHGFEVKASRSDWLRELKDPAKAESICRIADYFWVVIGDPAIVVDGELPQGWGLMVPRGKGLKVEIKAEKRDPAPLDRPTAVRLIRHREDRQDAEVRAAESKARKEAETGLSERAVEQLDHDDSRALDLGRRFQAAKREAGLEHKFGIDSDLMDPEALKRFYTESQASREDEWAKRKDLRLAEDLRRVADDLEKRHEPVEDEAAA